MISKTALTVLLLIHVNTLYAVKFHSYINEKGETVFSNLPRQCIKKSALTCLEYHPVMTTGAARSLSSDNSKPNLKKPVKEQQRLTHNNESYDSSFDVLNNIVEMNNLMNEYYPDKPDPAAAYKVRQQQENILEILQVIKGASSDGESKSIERAIDILRNNLID